MYRFFVCWDKKVAFVERWLFAEVQLYLPERSKSIVSRVQRKSFLQLAIWESWSKHLLAQTSFQLGPQIFWWAGLISQFFCQLNSSKYFTCLLGKLRAEFAGPITKSTSPWLSDTTFFARCLSQDIYRYSLSALTKPRWNQPSVIIPLKF